MEIITKWAIVALLALGALGNVVMIGEKRNPITHGTAAFAVIVNGLLITGVVSYWD